MAAVILSGCVGGDDQVKAAEEESVPQRADEAKATATTGSLRGTVSSDLFEPLAGAEVTIVETGQTTKVSRSGAFTINDIQPGTYAVFIVAVGYEALTRSVNIQAGEVADLGVQLKPLASDDPWLDYREIKGDVSWAVAWQIEGPVGCQVIDAPGQTIKNCGGRRGGGQNGEIAINVTEDVKTVVAELVWNPVGPLGEYLHLDALCPDVPRGSGGAVLDLDHPCFFDPEDSESPISIRADEEHWQEFGYQYVGDWAARVFSTYGMLGTYDATQIDAGVAYQQPFTHYVSVFHKAPAAADYTGVPEG